MSFAKDVKKQILEKTIEGDCCGLAFMSGLVNTAGEVDLETGEVSVITDLPDIFPFANKILGMLYGEYAELGIESEFKINKTTYYRIKLPTSSNYNMFTDLGLVNEVGKLQIERLPKQLLKDQCCKKAFVKGAFIGCGTSGIRLSKIPSQKTSSGYGVEFIAKDEVFLMDFAQMLKEYSISAKIAQRKNKYVLYIKESSAVSDLLALVDAYDSVLQLQNEMAIREVRNKVNRQINCLNANISKMVRASMRQLDAINVIDEQIGLENLPDDLHEVALLRLANQEESLDELLQLATFQITRSGLNNRLNRLIKMAEKLKSN